ncbi:SDR family NAD(P)-dependent oxidoreductase [Streptomyces canus]|uniref:SDR family NAD(P)-dependent oxidoreductase n=1 Tax=Streptomyces canus TaxID=58343 RepID=UPI0033B134B8
MKHGKVVVVTGASGGVGRATARAFAERGARVALLARGREGLAAAADEVQQAGGEALDDGAAAGPQHTPVRMGVEPDAGPGPSGRAGGAGKWPSRPVGWAPR